MKNKIFSEKLLIFKFGNLEEQNTTESTPVFEEQGPPTREQLSSLDRENRGIQQELFAQELELAQVQGDFDGLDFKLNIVGRRVESSPQYLSDQTIIDITDKTGKVIGKLSLYARRSNKEDEKPRMLVSIDFGSLQDGSLVALGGYDIQPADIYECLEQAQVALSVTAGLNLKNLNISSSDANGYIGGLGFKIYSKIEGPHLNATITREKDGSYTVSNFYTDASNLDHAKDNKLANALELRKYLKQLDKTLS